MYLLSELKNHGLSYAALHVISTEIVLSVITYVFSSFVGQLSKGDKAQIDSLFRKAVTIGVCCQTYTTDELILAGDKNYFTK